MAGVGGLVVVGVPAALIGYFWLLPKLKAPISAVQSGAKVFQPRPEQLDRDKFGSQRVGQRRWRPAFHQEPLPINTTRMYS